MTIYERALELIPDGAAIGLGSGRAASAFVRLLGEKVRSGRLHVRAVPTSTETARIATENGIPLTDLNETSELAITIDGADEVDPDLNLIKGYGRALVREKVVAAASRLLVILVGEEKQVDQLGARGRLPIEIVLFAAPFCSRRLALLGMRPTLWMENGRPGTTDNGNAILDCAIDAIADAASLEKTIRSIPGVIGTGLFLGMTHTVLVGETSDFRLVAERSSKRT